MADAFRSVAAKTQALLETPAYGEAAVSFIDELLDKVPSYVAAAKTVREAGAPALDAAHAADLAAPPKPLLDALDAFRVEVEFVVKVLNAASLFIHSRVPEMKEEDNAGVMIQMQVLETLGDLRKVFEQGVKGKDSGATRFVSLKYKLDYLTARAELEEKLNPSGKDAQPSKSASLKLALVEQDKMALADVAASYLALRRYALSLVSAFTKNIEKLAMPRRNSVGMIG